MMVKDLANSNILPTFATDLETDKKLSIMKLYQVKLEGVVNGTEIKKIEKLFTDNGHAMAYLEKLEDDNYHYVKNSGWDCSEDRDKSDNLRWFTINNGCPTLNNIEGCVTEVEAIEGSGKTTYEVCVHYIATKTVKVEAYDEWEARRIADVTEQPFDDAPSVYGYDVEELD